MSDMIYLIVYTFVALGAIFTLMKEFKRPQKNVFLISIEFFLLVAMIVSIGRILI